MSRRGTADRLVTIFWRDIPAQVNASSGGVRASYLLSDRFQSAIDRAATVADKTETDAYVAEWRRVARNIVGDPDAAATAECELLETTYHDNRLESLVWSGGIDEQSSPFTGDAESSSGGEL